MPPNCRSTWHKDPPGTCADDLLHEPDCEVCYSDLVAVEEPRRAYRAAASRLGTVSARSSELFGSAVGAVSAASMAAGRYFLAGAASGAQSAWQGARPAPGLEVRIPRPEHLPPPLADEPVQTPARASAEAPEGAGRGAAREQNQEGANQELKGQIRQFTEAFAAQAAAQQARASPLV